MNNTKPIVKGSIVKYKDGHYKVTAVFGMTHVNLAGVFSGKIHHKRISLGQMVEDEKAWYDEWTKSESYKCM